MGIQILTRGFGASKQSGQLVERKFPDGLEALSPIHGCMSRNGLVFAITMPNTPFFKSWDWDMNSKDWIQRPDTTELPSNLSVPVSPTASCSLSSDGSYFYFVGDGATIQRLSRLYQFSGGHWSLQSEVSFSIPATALATIFAVSDDGSLCLTVPSGRVGGTAALISQLYGIYKNSSNAYDFARWIRGGATTSVNVNTGNIEYSSDSTRILLSPSANVTYATPYPCLFVRSPGEALATTTPNSLSGAPINGARTGLSSISLDGKRIAIQGAGCIEDKNLDLNWQVIGGDALSESIGFISISGDGNTVIYRKTEPEGNRLIFREFSGNNSSIQLANFEHPVNDSASIYSGDLRFIPKPVLSTDGTAFWINGKIYDIIV